jgi:endo-1,4-beta-xylanase
MVSRPQNTRSSPGFVAACLAAAALTACASSGGGGESGSAGASGGGSTGAAGTGGTSGVAGAGGVTGAGGSASAGVTGSGGVTSTGGAAGTTSVAGSGGSSGSGGAAGIGGTGGGGVAGAGGSTGGAGGRGGATAGSGGRGGAAGAGGARGGATGSGGAAGGTGGTSPTCPPATTPTGGTKYCSNSKGNSSGGYAYELWADGGGSGCMTVYGGDARFSATWTNVGDLLARVGLNFDQTKTPTQIGTISSDFAEKKTGGTTGLVYVGIYGWTVSPLREYYILEDWGSTMPGGTASDGSPRTSVGTITVDGETYDVWKNTRVNKPNITGTDQTFDQYFSIRRTARQCGHISISTHFSEWTRLGLSLGKLYEAKLLIEAQDSTGTIDFTTATVVVK